MNKVFMALWPVINTGSVIRGMVAYRRNRVPGGVYFFTVTLCDRRSRILVERIEALREAFRRTNAVKPSNTLALVVLPDHFHWLCRMPPGETDYSDRIRRIKREFSVTLRQTVWQPRFWEHTIRDESDLQRHVDYIHFNPVKHGLVQRVADWPYSSFHRWVDRGELPRDWGGVVDTSRFQGRRFGEP